MVKEELIFFIIITLLDDTCEARGEPITQFVINGLCLVPYDHQWEKKEIERQQQKQKIIHKWFGGLPTVRR